MKTPIALCALIAGVALGGLTGCRGEPSTEPPIHLNRNMDTQDKLKPYRESNFFGDHRAMRQPPEGTVAWGRAATDRPMVDRVLQPDDDMLRADDAYHLGYADVDAEQNPVWVEEIPAQPSMQFLRRGQERYEIYCTPCHASDGYGKGPVALRSWPIPVPSYHDERLLEMPVGQIYAAITYGVNNYNMPSYANQIPVADRWAIVAYVRALQLSQTMQPGAGN